MSDLVRHQLHVLFTRHGPSLCDHPRQLEEMLRTECPRFPGQVQMLVRALEGGVAGELQAAPPDRPWDVVSAPLQKRLVTELGWAASDAKWTVETWGLALGCWPRGQQQPWVCLVAAPNPRRPFNWPAAIQGGGVGALAGGSVGGVMGQIVRLTAAICEREVGGIFGVLPWALLGVVLGALLGAFVGTRVRDNRIVMIGLSCGAGLGALAGLIYGGILVPALAQHPLSGLEIFQWTVVSGVVGLMGGGLSGIALGLPLQYPLVALEEKRGRRRGKFDLPDFDLPEMELSDVNLF